jgi:dTDP-glucose 4,6-dehydratase
MEKSLLIIGGTGFFGKSILDSFKRGLLNEFKIDKIYIFARNTGKFKLEYPELCFSGVDLINGDISNIKELPYADYVIHAATSTNLHDYLEGSNLNFEKSTSNFCEIILSLYTFYFIYIFIPIAIIINVITLLYFIYKFIRLVR